MLDVTAIHVDHRLRPSSGAEADQAAALADAIGVDFRLRHASMFERRAQPRGPRPRRPPRALPPGALTGHTADDQAETMLINLLRGAGTTGWPAIRPGPTKPILALRRAETRRCAVRSTGLTPVDDPTNGDPRFVRNRVRAELLPLLDDIAGRDVAALLARTAELLATTPTLLDELAGDARPHRRQGARGGADPTASPAGRCGHGSPRDGYPPDLATVDRVLDVARGAASACEIGGGRRVERKATSNCASSDNGE